MPDRKPIDDDPTPADVLYCRGCGEELPPPAAGDRNRYERELTRWHHGERKHRPRPPSPPVFWYIVTDADGPPDVAGRHPVRPFCLDCALVMPGPPPPPEHRYRHAVTYRHHERVHTGAADYPRSAPDLVCWGCGRSSYGWPLTPDLEISYSVRYCPTNCGGLAPADDAPEQPTQS